MDDEEKPTPWLVRNPTGRGGFKPGQSGNPGGLPGRSKGIAAYLREQTKDLREVADLFIGVMRGTPMVDNETGDVTVPAAKDRLEAGKWIADRAIGKAIELVASVDASENEGARRLVSELTKEELLTVLASGKQKA